MSWLRRWGGYLALVVVFATVCGLLSWWQWARREEALDRIAVIEANYDAAPVPVAEVLPDPDAEDEAAQWTPVTLVGEYLPEQQLVVRNRPYGAAAGFEVLVPLRTADGTLWIVDRGWVPVGSTPDAPDAVPAPPSGEVTVVVRLRTGEATIAGRGAPAGQVATINLPTIADLLGDEVAIGMYGQLVSEDPAPASAPLPAVPPEVDEGPHLSYALQWIAFGLLAVVALVWAVRRERRIAREDAGEIPARPARTRVTDADIEDALLDAAEGASAGRVETSADQARATRPA